MGNDMKRDKLLPGQAYITVKAEWMDGAWRVLGLDEIDPEYGQLHRLFVPSDIYTPTPAQPAEATVTQKEMGLPTEQMCDAARGFIMGLDMQIRTWGPMRKHLRLGAYPTIDYIEQQPEDGHITKWDIAHCIWLLMEKFPRKADCHEELWQPIETAPLNKEILVGWYDEPSMDDVAILVLKIAKPKVWGEIERAWFNKGSGNYSSPKSLNQWPTHWMPKAALARATNHQGTGKVGE